MTTTSRGTWLIAGTAVERRYPCFCQPGRRCKTDGPWVASWCRCWGRLDATSMPRHCCSWRHPAVRQQIEDDQVRRPGI